jgi:cell division protein FtsW (lipid II flippase)
MLMLEVRCLDLNSTSALASTYVQWSKAMQTETKQLRSFGLTVGGIFAVIGLWPLLFRSEDARWWAVTLGGLLVVSALVFPGTLSWVYKRWMALGHIMGWINTRIILSVVFYFVVTPIGMIRRLLGTDPMGKKIRTDLNSYWIIRKFRLAAHLRRQY